MKAKGEGEVENSEGRIEEKKTKSVEYRLVFTDMLTEIEWIENGW